MENNKFCFIMIFFHLFLFFYFILFFMVFKQNLFTLRKNKAEIFNCALFETLIIVSFYGFQNNDYLFSLRLISHYNYKLFIVNYLMSA